MLRRSLNVLVFALAFVLTAWTIRRVAPMPDVLVVKDKLEYFADHKDEFQALFCGSSRTNSGLDPEVFDATLRENGITARSFNLGVPAMMPPEQFWMIDEVLAQRPRSLRWIFIELLPLQLHTIGAEETSPTIRDVYWRGWRETAICLRAVWHDAGADRAKPLGVPEGWDGAPKELWKRCAKVIPPAMATWIRFAGGAGAHLALFARCQSNIGLFARMEEELGEDTSSLETRGFMPRSEVIEGEALERYETVLQKLEHAPPLPPDPVAARAYGELLARVRRHGVTPVCFTTPTSLRRDFYPSPPPGEPLLAYNDPQRYGVLYEPGSRRNVDHLNKTGAAQLTRLLGLDFVSLVQRNALR